MLYRGEGEKDPEGRLIDPNLRGKLIPLSRGLHLRDGDQAPTSNLHERAEQGAKAMLGL